MTRILRQNPDGRIPLSQLDAMSMTPTVLCYYFPNYHQADKRNAQVHGPGWNEWELV